MDNFGERLKSLIKQSDYKTSKRFGEKAGYSQVAISNLLKGKSNPSYEFIVTLITLMPDVDLKWLLTGEEQLPNKQLEEKIELEVKKQVKKRVDAAIAKHSGSGMNPQLSLPGFGRSYVNQLTQIRP